MMETRPFIFIRKIWIVLKKNIYLPLVIKTTWLWKEMRKEKRYRQISRDALRHKLP